MVGLRIVNEAHGLDVATTLQERLADAMHSVHHATVTRKNDRKREITLQHQACVVDYLAAS
jgi:hypothetical protein